MKLALVPPGEFHIGSPPSEDDHRENELQHHVKITEPFYLSVHEVTQKEFERVTGRNPSLFVGHGGPNDRVTGVETGKFPVETVYWYDAVEFCNLLSQRDGLQPCYRMSDVERNPDASIRSATVRLEKADGYRLPTEAQWEYACRAGTTTPFNFGSVNNGQDANVDSTHPYGTEAEGPYYRGTTEVGQYRANAFGMHDMHGNVWEWCEDWYDDQFYNRSPENDPRGPETGTRRVSRGGCWSSFAGYSRSAMRTGDAPDHRDSSTGFRVARCPSPATTLRLRSAKPMPLRAPEPNRSQRLLARSIRPMPGPQHRNGPSR